MTKFEERMALCVDVFSDVEFVLEYTGTQLHPGVTAESVAKLKTKVHSGGAWWAKATLEDVMLQFKNRSLYSIVLATV